MKSIRAYIYRSVNVWEYARVFIVILSIVFIAGCAHIPLDCDGVDTSVKSLHVSAFTSRTHAERCGARTIDAGPGIISVLLRVL